VELLLVDALSRASRNRPGTVVTGSLSSSIPLRLSFLASVVANRNQQCKHRYLVCIGADGITITFGCQQERV